jgi:hypothetical protein
MNVTGVYRRVRSVIEAKRARKFFTLPYQERVDEIKRIYSHARMKPSFDRYFEMRIPPEGYTSPYFDVVAAYARELDIKTALQIGCFGCQDSTFLAYSGFKGRLLASDFDPARLDYLKSRFATDPANSRIEFACLDLEAASTADFEGVGLVFALAVLSNIQPEGLERLFQTIAASPVRLCVFGDIFRLQTLTRKEDAQSVPSSSRNWFHPLISIAKRSGMEAIFVPGLSDNDFRGIFVIHKGISTDVHKLAVGQGFGNYVARQANIDFNR